MSTDGNIISALYPLPTGLIDDFLVYVFEKLNDVDLIMVSRKNNSYKDLISKRIINKKLLNLNHLSQTRKKEILETFGKSMVKLNIDEINLNKFLDTVMKYCSPRKLAEVELKLTEPVTVDLDKIKQSMPFFTNLYKIKLQMLESERTPSFEFFLKRLIVAATNLQSLQLHHVNMRCALFKKQEMKSLREFRLIEPYFLCSAALTRFIRSLPNLETFMYKGDDDITFIGSTLANCCPKLKNFADIQMLITDNHETVCLRRYNFLSSFSQLNYITLTSYTLCGSDLFRPLVELASKNIQKLQIHVDLESAVAYSGTDRERIMRSSFAEFRSLRELKICVQNSIVVADLQCDFIMHFATQLQNLDTFSLKSGKLANANKIIELLPKINKLSITEALFKHLPVEMRKIVRTLRKIQHAMEPVKERKVLKLVVNVEQWTELQVYKDSKNLIEAILDPVLEQYDFHRRES